jgi:hypothetical protein
MLLQREFRVGLAEEGKSRHLLSGDAREGAARAIW